MDAQGGQHEGLRVGGHRHENFKVVVECLVDAGRGTPDNHLYPWTTTPGPACLQGGYTPERAAWATSPNEQRQ